MKKNVFIPFLLLILSLSSCRSNMPSCDEVVCETVHRYGVSLDPGDWSERGQNGQVVSMRKDGVAVTRSYEGGVLHGECMYTFPHREVVEKSEVYKHGAKTEETTHYSSGLPQQQIVYHSPQRQSMITWYEAGSPQAREERVKGAVVKGEYYNENYQVESRVDESNGLRTRRDGQGKLDAVDTIKNGQMVSNTTYHPDGTPAAVSPYVKGVIEGERHTFLPGGEPATIERWTSNVQHGITEVYEHGEKRADVPYVNGTKHGVEKRYWGGGEVFAQEVSWVEGDQHGPTHTYLRDTKQTDWYFHGRKVPNKATYDMMSSQ